MPLKCISAKAGRGDGIKAISGAWGQVQAAEHTDPLQVSDGAQPEAQELKHCSILGLNLRLLAKTRAVPNLSSQLHADQQLQAHLRT